MTPWPGWICWVHRLGGRVQVPARQAAEREEEQLAAGREQSWPERSRTAADRGGGLVVDDDSGPGREAADQSHRGPPRPHPGGAGDRGHQPPAGAGRGCWPPKPGHRPRLSSRTHRGRRGNERGGRCTGVTEADDAVLLDAAHQRPAEPLVGVGDHLTTHASAAMAESSAARPGLTVFRLPPYAHELNPVEPVGSPLKRSLANLTTHTLAALTALIKTHLTPMPYPPGLLAGFLASTALDLAPFL